MSTNNVKIYQKYTKTVENGKSIQNEKVAIYGSKGLNIKQYINKDGNKRKIVVKQDKDNGKFRIVFIENEKKEVVEKDNIDDVTSYLKKFNKDNKDFDLGFAFKIMESDKKKKSKK